MTAWERTHSEAGDHEHDFSVFVSSTLLGGVRETVYKCSACPATTTITEGGIG